MTRRKLIQVAEFRQIMAEGFRVQGTKLHVVELLMFGFAYKSRFILLRSEGFMKKLGDESRESSDRVVRGMFVKGMAPTRLEPSIPLTSFL